MAAVWSKRLSGPAAVVVATTTAFTVPASRVYVVRTITISCIAGAAGCLVSLYQTAAANANLLWHGTVGPGTTQLLDLRWAFAAAEILRYNAALGVGQAVTVSTHGYELQA